MRSLLRTLLILTSGLCIVSTQLRAQALGVMTGSVTDPSGAAVTKARVTATETGTGFERSIATDDAGHYTLPSLRPTEYSLTVEASGFAKYIQRNVRLIADQTATIDDRLATGLFPPAPITDWRPG
jgi:Carboxypeptidase regulatory-like domain